MTSNFEQADMELLPLGQIAQRCATESERYFQHQDSDPRFCYELVRRAILERHQGAWTLFYSQYRPLVAGWVLRHPAFALSGEDVQYFVNSAYEKFWAALSPARFANFPELKGVLRYLQTCVHSVIIDQIRLAEGRNLSLRPEIGHGTPANDTAHVSLEQAAREEFWRWLEPRLHNEKERKVVYGSFFLALKPRELYAEFKSMFRDIGEVHRVKENVLTRLRRDPELRAYFNQDD